MQFKTTVIYHLTPVRMAEIEVSSLNHIQFENWFDKKIELLYILN